VLNDRLMHSRARELFAELKSETRPADLVRRCRAASARRWRSHARGYSRAKILLMDEPTAAISVRQVAEVLDLIRRLRDSGIAILLISHRMPDVFPSPIASPCCAAATRSPTSRSGTARPRK